MNVTVDNRSGASYEDAVLKLVAGDVHTVQAAAQPKIMRAMAMADRAPEAFGEREFFEYHLYELSRPTTLKNNQQKQIELLTAAAVPVTKRYIAESRFSPYASGSRGDVPPRKVAVKLEFEIKTVSNLGRPLP